MVHVLGPYSLNLSSLWILASGDYCKGVLRVGENKSEMTNQRLIPLQTQLLACRDK